MQAPATAAQGFGPQWMARQRLGEAGEVFTFYSYKGGTGRSMGLVNCAGLIAQQLPSGAKPLLLIDFDLEAPGLHRYLAPCLDGYVSEQQPGTLELFEALSQQVDVALEQRGLDALDDESAAALVAAFDLLPFKLPVRLPGGATSGASPLELIVAGRFNDGYDARLQRFDWPGLYARAPALFRALSARLAAEHSLVFVDSRTGLADTSGISTMLLPDVLVLVFTPNSQSLTGIEHLVRKAVDYRARAPDLRPLRVYPLASRVDNQVEHFRQVWRSGDPAHPLFGAVGGYQPLFTHVFAQTLASGVDLLPTGLGEYFDQVQVPHAADYAFGERLCFTQQGSSDSLSIRGAYELFLPWLVTGAQPWERPGDKLLDLRAALWLRDAGVSEAPGSDDGWPAWLDRAARLTTTSDLSDLPLAALPAQRRFDVALAQSLAKAHVGDFGPARTSLDSAAAAHGEDLAPSLEARAPAALLRLLQGEPPPPEAHADAVAWLEEFDKLMARWQPLKSERRDWLEALVPLAAEWGAAELRWRAAVELDGEGSAAALQAQLAAAQARERAGDIAGALQLAEELAAAGVAPGAGVVLGVAAELLARLHARSAGDLQRPLPSINDCDSTAWVSFSHSDNVAWFDWVTQFTRELELGLRALLRGVKVPPLRVSQLGASGAGLDPDPAEGADRALARCFAFVLIAGDHAAQSDWCQREVAAFIELYGAAAAERLYVVAMTQGAMLRVQTWPVWARLDEASIPLVMPFFSRSDPNQPMPIFMAPGLVSNEFREPFTRLREDLALSIRRSLAVHEAPAAKATPEAAGARPTATLYIESNRSERSLWRPLGDVLRRRWQGVAGAGDASGPLLRVRGLPLDDDAGLAQLGDADGVLLLWGSKTPQALLAQIDKVEGRLPDPAPGLVAHLSPPNDPSAEPVPAWGWAVLRFLTSDPDAPAIHDDDAAELDRFLRAVRAHAVQRAGGPVA